MAVVVDNLDAIQEQGGGKGPLLDELFFVAGSAFSCRLRWNF